MQLSGVMGEEWELRSKDTSLAPPTIPLAQMQCRFKEDSTVNDFYFLKNEITVNILTGLQVALQYSWIEGRYSPNVQSNNGIHQFNGDNSEYNSIKQEHFTENISGQS